MIRGLPVMLLPRGECAVITMPFFLSVDPLAPCSGKVL